MINTAAFVGFPLTQWPQAPKGSTLRRLIALKNIFSKQLPNMPREYITRLVFDRRHRSVAIVKQDGLVVGGITYRPFHSQVYHLSATCPTNLG